MRPASGLFWVMPILVFLGTAVLAAAFFLRYRKEIRHAFLTVLASALYFLAYVFMVYATTLPQGMPGVPLLACMVVLADYAIIAWDVPLSFLYAMNEPVTKKIKLLAAAAATVPAAAGLATILFVLSSGASYERASSAALAAIDWSGIAPALAVAATSIRAGAGARSAAGGAKAARVACCALAALLLPAAFLLRYLAFPDAYPQGELSVVTLLLAWDIAASGLAFMFGPGEKEEGSVVSIPDSFLKEAGITAREAEALELLASGASYKDICATLGLSLPAVKKRISSVYRKSGAANRVELVNILLEYGRKTGPSGEE